MNLVLFWVKTVSDTQPKFENNGFIGHILKCMGGYCSGGASFPGASVSETKID